MANRTTIKPLPCSAPASDHRVAGRFLRAGAIVALLGLFPGPAAKTEILEVGPDKAFATPGDVPWERIGSGDEIRIHWRPEPYRNKWVICAAGTKESPIRVVGVPGPKGELPVIDGENATTRASLDYWGQARSVIKVGGAGFAKETRPAHIVIEGLEVRNARPDFLFTGRAGPARYKENAAGIHIEQGDHITIRNCVIHGCGNGLFSSNQSSNVTIEGCYIYGNGIVDSIYHHNVYTESNGIRFQFNRFGPLRIACYGNNIKDRSAGTMIVCNWIEGGSKLVDLVESSYEHIKGSPEYGKTVMFGNILIKLPGADARHVVHYGGDQGNEDNFRNGTLYFINNTVISRRPGPMPAFKLSNDAQTVLCLNNVFWGEHFAVFLVLMEPLGRVILRNNWIPIGFTECYFEKEKHVFDDGSSIVAVSPSFVARGDYRLAASSSCIDRAGPIPPEIRLLLDPLQTYVLHCRSAARDLRTPLDLGAFEAPPRTQR